MRSTALRCGLSMTMFQAAGFTLGRARLVALTDLQAATLLDPLRGRPSHQARVAELTTGPTLAMELVRGDAVALWSRMVGQGEERVGKEGDEGEEMEERGVVARGSSSVEEARREVGVLFAPTPSPLLRPAPSWHQGAPSTCLIIKPHAMAAAGALLEALQEEGLTLLALHTFLLTFQQAEEFLEVYKGVVEEYGEMVKQLSSGQCMVVQVGEAEGRGESVVHRVRELCGPPDPSTAKLIRPKSLRAR